MTFQRWLFFFNGQINWLLILFFLRSLKQSRPPTVPPIITDKINSLLNYFIMKEIQYFRKWKFIKILRYIARKFHFSCTYFDKLYHICFDSLLFIIKLYWSERFFCHYMTATWHKMLFHLWNFFKDN